MTFPSEINERLYRYVTTRDVVLKLGLGFGKDGTVYSTSNGRAIKIFEREGAYLRELECYQRLLHAGTRTVLGHNVPQLTHWNDELLALEMTIVVPPFLLDFASAYLDAPPDFPQEVLDEWEQAKSEEFGPRWSHVQMVMHHMQEQFGIYLLDVHPRNITFPSPGSGDHP